MKEGKNIIEDIMKFRFRKRLKDNIQCWKYFSHINKHFLKLTSTLEIIDRGVMITITKSF